MYIGVSKGTGVSSFFIRLFTSLVIRRDKMVDDKVSKLKAIFLIFLSLFGLTKYAKIKVQYNHAFLLYKSIDFNKWFTIDIVENGVIPMPATNTFKRAALIKIIEPDFDMWPGVRSVSHLFGKKYDYLGIFGAIWSIMKYMFTGKYDDDVKNSPKKYVCSEFVVTAIEATGEVELGNPIAVYPHLISELTDKHNRFKTVIEKKNLTVSDLI